MIKQRVSSTIRPAGPKVIPAPEMVDIPAPPGGAYTLLEGDGAPVPLAAFSIGRYPVTQAEWSAVMGSNPSHYQGDRLPVESVSWYEAVAFCERLSDSLGLTGSARYRLPTEAEWEWAASGGGGEDQRVTAKTGWYADNSGGRTHPVGEKVPNAFGIYDTLGNVWEWIQSKWGSDRVIRGGSWCSIPAHARVARRCWYAPDDRDQYLGFRLAKNKMNVDSTQRDEAEALVAALEAAP